MRILMLTDVYPPVVGGVEQHVRNLSVELVRRGHDVSVVTLRRDGAPDEELDAGVQVHRVDSTTQRLLHDGGRLQLPPFPDPEVARAIRRIVAREHPDIVHAHNWMVRSYLPLKRSTGVPLVVSLHDYGLVCPKKSLLRDGIACERPTLAACLRCSVAHYGAAKGLPTALAQRELSAAALRAVDLFLPVSTAVATGNALERRGAAYRVIPNFIPDDPDGPGDAERRGVPQVCAALPADGFLLFVGALAAHKGVRVLLRAYAGLRDAPPLVLIGARWPESPREVPPNTVVLHDWPQPAVMAAWRRCSLALAPSIWPEPCPTVVMEAMASGRPVIASAAGGLPDLVVDGGTGLLVPPGDAGALREAIAGLLAAPQRAREMGEAGRRRVAAFRAGAVVPRIEAVYEGLARRRAMGGAA